MCVNGRGAEDWAERRGEEVGGLREYSGPGRVNLPLEGQVERAREVLVVIKTTAKRLRQLERDVKRVHSYEVPEFVVLPIVAGSREYFKWIRQNAG